MKLLIVDDEELTRTGVVSSIDWRSLGIDEIIQADDGVNGLEMARLHHPEIILCDVRMPRMNGITMLEKIEQFLPDTVSIFMSGYSDKEYLKAAIRLKTVNYVEKPLDPSDIREAVLEAIRRYNQNRHSRRGEELQSIQSASRLALLLTVPYSSGGQDDSQKDMQKLTEELSLSLSSASCFTCIIVRLQSAPENARAAYDEIYHHLEQFLKGYQTDCLSVEKKPQHMVYFMIGKEKPSTRTLSAICNFLGSFYASYGHYYIAAGKTCKGITRAYQSYTDAVILLQSSFFFPAGTLLTAEMLTQTATSSEQPDFSVSAEQAFTNALSSLDAAGCDLFFKKLFQSYDGCRSLMPNQVRDLYYKLFLVLEETGRGLHLNADRPVQTDNIMDEIENSFTYEDLHQALVSRTHRLLDDAQNAAPENTTIAQIKEYISKNYKNELLSVKDISSHMFLSVSYVCTFFKNETGKTLNQYLTEYRMERAKELLADPQYKISEISSMVGYSDGNYFGKSFKKYTGLTPSEYREKMTR
ncbi:MAG: response regulator [Lachnospiraceae bacterium]|nr:response regulator [Lachnospiraceae bacterium]